eukprot:FR738328.1.p1 GENE.FR738328.1~~FR738328.1.p1  ORF type:complete len:298 (+),score=23.79 FR738328.1:113-895(+)
MRDFLKLALPGLIMIMEWWASEIAIIMSGTGGSDAVEAEARVATMALYQTMNSFCFMFAIGFQVSAATRVGHELGAGNPTVARRAAFVSASLAFCESTILAITLFLLRKVVPGLFTGHADASAVDLRKRVSSTVGLLSIYVIGDAVSTSFGGSITGAGRQCYAAVVVLISYFGVALPMAYTFGIRYEGGVTGIVFGMLVGTWLQALGNAAVVCNTDFRKESIKATTSSKGPCFSALQTTDLGDDGKPGHSLQAGNRRKQG